MKSIILITALNISSCYKKKEISVYEEKPIQKIPMSPKYTLKNTNTKQEQFNKKQNKLRALHYKKK